MLTILANPAFYHLRFSRFCPLPAMDFLVGSYSQNLSVSSHRSIGALAVGRRDLPL